MFIKPVALVSQLLKYGHTWVTLSHGRKKSQVKWSGGCVCWSKATECHLIMYEGFLKPCIRRSALFKSVIPEKKGAIRVFQKE